MFMRVRKPRSTTIGDQLMKISEMDTIHEAILANAKSAPVEVAPEPVSKEIEDASAAKLDELHQSELSHYPFHSNTPY